MAGETRTWTKWTERRPGTAGLYWWRLPEATYGGVTTRPEWIAEVGMVGMGYADPQLWPLFSHWDGATRTVPAGLEWASAASGAKNGDHVMPGVELLSCPFCGAAPRLIARDRPDGGGFRLYSAPFRPNEFSIVCACGLARGEARDLVALMAKWNKRTPESP